MPIARGTPRFALRPAADSTVTTEADGNCWTFLNYREGWVATKDPKLSKILIGVACASAVVGVGMGVVAIINGFSKRGCVARAIPTKRPELPRGTYR